jgi:hypothetical protein
MGLDLLQLHRRNVGGNRLIRIGLGRLCSFGKLGRMTAQYRRLKLPETHSHPGTNNAD